VKETSLEKGSRFTFREKGQYALAFGVVAVMLYLVGFPVFLLFFFGVLTFFIWKAFTSGSRNDTKQIFDFYLAANEIVSNGERRWFGFEMKEAIVKGETILREMSAPPPLVHFVLGALYQKSGDHSSAVKYLNRVAGESAMDESAVVFPTRELRDYVRILRKIERSPSESPMTWEAVSSLEQLRNERACEMLQLSKKAIGGEPLRLGIEAEDDSPESAHLAAEQTSSSVFSFAELAKARKRTEPERTNPHERSTISEVLHDIYDEKIQ
jgi:hypothetical protein